MRFVSPFSSLSSSILVASSRAGPLPPASIRQCRSLTWRHRCRRGRGGRRVVTRPFNFQSEAAWAAAAEVLAVAIAQPDDVSAAAIFGDADPFIRTIDPEDDDDDDNL